MALLAVAGTAGAAGGEPTEAELQEARRLFDDARKDEQASRWGDAFVKFQQVAAIRETASVVYHTGYCQEKMGLLASAYNNYEKASALAQATKGRDWQLIVNESAEQLRVLLPRVPVLVLKLPKGLEGVKVTLDGKALSQPFDGAMRVDPGHHDLAVTANEHEPYQDSFSLAERQSRTLEITLKRRPPPAAAPAAAPAGPKPPGPASPGGDSAGPPTQLVWATGVSSFVLASVATAFYFSGRKATSDINDFCERDFCDRDKLEKTRDLNYVFAGVAGGAALLSGGAAVWLGLSGPSKPAGQGVSVAVTPGGLGVAGRF